MSLYSIPLAFRRSFPSDFSPERPSQTPPDVCCTDLLGTYQSSQDDSPDQPQAMTAWLSGDLITLFNVTKIYAGIYSSVKGPLREMAWN